MDANLEKAKAVIMEEVARAGYEVRKILLFGSRARGDARPDSDWDFIVVVDREMDRPTRREISANIRKRLVFQGMVADVLIFSQEVAREKSRDVGHILYYVAKEGVPL